ncbi:hypothetical protein Bcav_1273 [Beutenbergia cavernae DSM 12333]|uniref:Uncharacterized protein n=1 Tax=Beutenbergia cavernae (strain ATCC BAA-8 / DSM 12333 / CCUG 43141 / JCM 11478 / NBRC 16432 / NCIMB 13614 / HKI 0122) TaxID=471853 RepID=C5C1R5_BEUC1|nr:hypothetical protein [Beutenbergia cavernae]ACQ79533.1 hypothetical protein Bcav_1273 [Beutenbergia cavernae DSM 12333]
MFPWDEAVIADLGLRRERLLDEVLGAPGPLRRWWRDRKLARAEARAARAAQQTPHDHTLTA